MSSMPRRGHSEVTSRSSSARTRSAETMASREDMAVMASITSGATSKPSWAVKRAARMMRNGSSSKDCSAVTGVRRSWPARSSIPPVGSTKLRSGRRRAMALTVKSRRVRSPSSVVPYSTCGLREPMS